VTAPSPTQGRAAGSPGYGSERMALLHGWRTCPRCAGDLENAGGRAVCDSCGSTFYANSAPCVSALIEDGAGRLLLARRAVEPFRDRWDAPGGFLEEGEHPLDGLRRELLEETGLEGEPARFVGVWMDVYGDAPEAAATLNLYWTVRLAGGEPVASDDVAELRWFSADELPGPDELAFATVVDALAAWRDAAEE
jgi:ADP-ribose pyrophosphatase YjhB (NUDIX family)